MSITKIRDFVVYFCIPFLLFLPKSWFVWPDRFGRRKLLYVCMMVDDGPICIM